MIVMFYSHMGISAISVIPGKRWHRCLEKAPNLNNYSFMNLKHHQSIREENLVTVMTCNEVFDPQRPDTFFEKV